MVGDDQHPFVSQAREIAFHPDAQPQTQKKPEKLANHNDLVGIVNANYQLGVMTASNQHTPLTVAPYATTGTKKLSRRHFYGVTLPPVSKPKSQNLSKC
jgi:hypothetical protein